MIEYLLIKVNLNFKSDSLFYSENDWKIFLNNYLGVFKITQIFKHPIFLIFGCEVEFVFWVVYKKKLLNNCKKFPQSLFDRILGPILRGLKPLL